MRTLKGFFNKFVIFVIFLNTQMDLFILKTDVEKFTSTNKKTLHLIFKNILDMLVFCWDRYVYILQVYILQMLHKNK